MCVLITAHARLYPCARAVTRRGGGQQRERSRAPPPIHPFLSWSNSHWFPLNGDSRAPQGRAVWFVKGREDKTRPSSSSGHLLTKHRPNTKWLLVSPLCRVSPSTSLASSCSVFSILLSSLHPPLSRWSLWRWSCCSQITVVACKDLEMAIWPLCVCAKEWMDSHRGNVHNTTITPTDMHTHPRTHTTACTLVS